MHEFWPKTLTWQAFHAKPPVLFGQLLFWCCTWYCSTFCFTSRYAPECHLRDLFPKKKKTAGKKTKQFPLISKPNLWSREGLNSTGVSNFISLSQAKSSGRGNYPSLRYQMVQATFIFFLSLFPRPHIHLMAGWHISGRWRDRGISPGAHLPPGLIRPRGLQAAKKNHHIFEMASTFYVALCDWGRRDHCWEKTQEVRTGEGRRVDEVSEPYSLWRTMKKTVTINIARWMDG